MNPEHDLLAQRPSAAERTPYQCLLDELELNLPPDMRIKQSHVSYEFDGVDLEIRLEEEDARICIVAHIGTPKPADELKMFHGLLAHQLELMTPAFVVVGWDRGSASFQAISHHYPSEDDVQVLPFLAHVAHCVQTAKALRSLYWDDAGGAGPEASRSSMQPAKAATAHILRRRLTEPSPLHAGRWKSTTPP